jgi:hypothetical protein
MRARYPGDMDSFKAFMKPWSTMGRTHQTLAALGMLLRAQEASSAAQCVSLPSAACQMFSDRSLNSSSNPAPMAGPSRFFAAFDAESLGLLLGSTRNRSPAMPRPPPCAMALAQKRPLLMSIGSLPCSSCFSCTATAPRPTSVAMSAKP